MPRRASASITCGSSMSRSEHSCHSSTVAFGCTPGRCCQDSTRSSVSETSALYTSPESRSQQTTVASREIGSAGWYARTTSFGGSLSSIDAIRHRSVTPWSRRSTATVCRNSSADSGSSGCRMSVPACGVVVVDTD